MSDSYYRFFPGDYIRDTGDLTLVEHGAYNILLHHYYMQEWLPSDHQKLYRICRAFSEDERKAIDVVVDRYFTDNGDGRIINRKAEEEIAERKAFIEAQSARGKAGANARWATKDITDGMAQALQSPLLEYKHKNGLPSPSPSPSPIPIKKEKTLSGKEPDSPPKIPFKEVVSYLNEKTGKTFKPSSQKTRTFIQARFREGFTLDDFKKVIDLKTSEWKSDPKMAEYLRPETLFGTKFESYLNSKPNDVPQKPEPPKEQPRVYEKLPPLKNWTPKADLLGKQPPDPNGTKSLFLKFKSLKLPDNKPWDPLHCIRRSLDLSYHPHSIKKAMHSVIQNWNTISSPWTFMINQLGSSTVDQSLEDIPDQDVEALRNELSTLVQDEK
jgi:uncharacterized phage protein (TIGR02220 family)